MSRNQYIVAPLGIPTGVAPNHELPGTRYAWAEFQNHPPATRAYLNRQFSTRRVVTTVLLLAAGATAALGALRQTQPHLTTTTTTAQVIAAIPEATANATNLTNATNTTNATNGTNLTNFTNATNFINFTNATNFTNFTNATNLTSGEVVLITPNGGLYRQHWPEGATPFPLDVETPAPKGVIFLVNEENENTTYYMTFDEQEPRLDIVCQQNDSSLIYVSVQCFYEQLDNALVNITNMGNNTVLVSAPPGLIDEELKEDVPFELYLTAKETETDVKMVWMVNYTQVDTDYLPIVEEPSDCKANKVMQAPEIVDCKQTGTSAPNSIH